MENASSGVHSAVPQIKEKEDKQVKVKVVNKADLP